MNSRHTVLLLSAVLLLASCGQTTSPAAGTPTAPVVTTPVPAIPVPATATATLKVFIPTAGGIQAQYLPSTTTGLRVRLPGFDQTYPVGTGAAGCTAVTGGVNCTFTLTVTSGPNQTLRIDALNVDNRVLSTSTQSVTVVKGQNNAFDVLLTGVPAAGLGTLTPTSRASEVTVTGVSSATLDRGGAFSFGVALRDISNQVIVNPGLPTFTVCSTNPDFTVAGGATTTAVVTAPEPTGGLAQTTTLFIPTDGNCTLTTGLYAFAATTLTVPASHLAVTVPATVVAGSSFVASAQLFTALGNPLTVAGRSVTFNGTTVSTNAAGQASTNIVAPGYLGSNNVVVGTEGNVTTVTYQSVAGTVNSRRSTLTVNPNIVKVGASISVTVALYDDYGNPVTTPPTLNAYFMGVVIGAPSVSGNVFTFPVTAPPTPGDVHFDATVDGNTVGTGTLFVSPYPISVTDGTTPIPDQYDFTSSDRDGKAFTLNQPGSNSNAFTVSTSNSNVTTILQGNRLIIFPVSAGLTTVTLTDGYGQATSFDVSVTTVSVFVH